MKNLFSFLTFFREKPIFTFADDDSAIDRQSKHLKKKDTTRKQTLCHENKSVIFGYSSGKQTCSYPVHTFSNDVGYNNSSALSPQNYSVPESCSSSILESDFTIDYGMMSSSLNSIDLSECEENYDILALKRVQDPLMILVGVFSNENRRFFINSDETAKGSGKMYRTEIPTELITSTLMNYCSRQLTHVMPSAFGLIKSLTTLQLCCNNLSDLPEEICTLRRLETLSLSNNKLKSIPSTIGYLVNLEKLYLDRNQLSTLPRSISGLRKLKVISLAANEFSEIPRSVMTLNRLTTLECDRNPKLIGVPSEIIRFSQLARFHVEECPKLLKESQYKLFSKERSSSGMPSLFECSARSLIRHHNPVLNSIPRHLKLFLSRAEECSFCSGPMIDFKNVQCRTIKRIDRPFPIIDQTCCEHWKTDEERLKAIFSPYPASTPAHLISTDLRNRNAENLVPFNRFDPERLMRGKRILRKFESRDLVKVLVPLALVVDWPQYPIM